MNVSVDSARIMDQWQVTIPADVRKALGVDKGDSVSFIVEGNTVRLENPEASAFQTMQGKIALEAMREAQIAFAGVAEELGLHDEDDVQALVNEVRYGEGTK